MFRQPFGNETVDVCCQPLYAWAIFFTAFSMSRLSHQFAFVALILWLLGNWLGAHGHFCFDGQEPPVSVHVHLDGHHSHEHQHHQDDAEHKDADVELVQLVIAKISKIDIGLILLAVLSLLLVFQPQRITHTRYTVLLPHHRPFARPLLRAPPLTA